MKNTINILYGVSMALCVILVIIGVIGSRRQLYAAKCSGIEVELIDSSTRQFITSAGVKKIIDKEYGGYLNVPTGHINLSKIEEVLAGEGIMEEHDAYFTRDAVLHVKVRQCTPLVRISGSAGTWYVCRGNRWFKVKDDWCKDIPTLNGNARENDRTWMERISALGEFIQEHESMAGNISRMSCDDKGELRIRFDARSEDFLFGQPSGLKRKFALVDSYVKMMDKEENAEKKYKTVKVKYENQIVCR